jgi:hypothetical protein
MEMMDGNYGWKKADESASLWPLFARFLSCGPISKTQLNNGLFLCFIKQRAQDASGQ